MQKWFVLVILFSLFGISKKASAAGSLIIGVDSYYFYGQTTTPPIKGGITFKSVAEVWGEWEWPLYDEYTEKEDGSTRETMVFWNNHGMSVGTLYEFNDGVQNPDTPVETDDDKRRPHARYEVANYSNIERNGAKETRYTQTRINAFIIGGRVGKTATLRLTVNAQWYADYPGATFPGDMSLYPGHWVDPVADGLTCAGIACDSAGTVFIDIPEDGTILDITPSLPPGITHWGFSIDGGISMEEQ